MVKVLLDTNALAEPIRPAPNPGFMRRFRASDASLAIASVTLHEATYGVERLAEGKRKQSLRDYLRDVVSKLTVLPYDEVAADWHARERTRLERLGKTMPYADGQIAAIAVVNGLVLVTSNARDFRGVRDLEVDDWRT